MGWATIMAKASPVFTFANQVGLDMLETTLVALQDIMLDKILNEAGRKTLCSEFSKIVQQGFCRLPVGICVGRPVSYQQAIAWKVLNEDDSNQSLFGFQVHELGFHLKAYFSFQSVQSLC
ncbi:hypothetical protein IFM89_013318 [Coptis chinensis]|uniref:MEKHLA domain-containing protein n=1 Tax=Coptis chinensis TaxID=261450 RepID=A0A835LRE3_9MAGN|nr:hypothetical protein IFM89_013318 [Coptis chinensis]